MENQPICIVCAKSCVTAKDYTTCPNCSRSLHKTCSTSKIRDNPFENKNPVSSCLLCDSRIINASHDKHFDSMRSENFTLGTCDDNSNHCDFFDNCVYHDVKSLNHVVNLKTDELFILHFNVCSLQKNIDNLITLLATFSETPDIIAISETKLTHGQPFVNVDITGYDFIHCASITKAGGVGFYVKQNLSYKQKSDININLNFVENMWIEVKTNNGPIVIGVIYRHPTTLVNDYESFSTNLCDIFADLRDSNTAFYAVGDYNIDLMQINGNHNFRKYVNNILSTSTKCAIDLPTRITDHSKTVLDHIYVNDPKHSYTSGVLLCDLSDHMATFVSISTKKSRVKSKVQFLIRDMKNFNLEKFLRALENDLTAANLNSIESAQVAFDKFEEVLHIVVNKFAPLKKASRKEKKLSQKPWVSRELLNLIKQKNKLFKELHKKFDGDIFQKYKKQRNALNREIKRAKENYYKDLIDDSKGNSSTLWKIIGELANLKKKKKRHFLIK